MVRRTHQGFLIPFATQRGPEPVPVSVINSSNLKNIAPLEHSRDLFDTPGNYVRQIPLSWLDKNIDDEKEWERLVAKATLVDELLLVDDRTLANNPILHAFDRQTKIRYLQAFRSAGVNAQLVHVID